MQSESDLKQPRVAALKPPFTSGPGTTQKSQPVPALQAVSLPHSPQHLRAVGASQGTDPDFSTNWTISEFCSSPSTPLEAAAP